MTEPSLPQESIFLQALAISSTAERAAFLDRACGANRDLRVEVEALLRAHAQSGDRLDLPDKMLATVDEPIRERPGTVIGPYKLLEQIGEGGFGVVFMAEQTEPVRRRVALKILKPGMDTRHVVARFQAERQALAIMDHPNIAKVLDGGETALGRPFFVMELVRGVPITDFCDQNHFMPRQRLELFLSVCQAVQHAHQKGIIHRDLKPSNVLVTVHDTTPIVKVIDFGVAKALGQELTDKTLFTGFAQMIGTPLYMSPEQAGQSGLDIDTRSDIYSLGVLLYELLAGITPFDRQRFKKAGQDEIRRIIREEEPPRPSTRLSTTDELPSIAANRNLEPRKLTGLLRGELDWIVMKCLEKDRNRRYETANGLALDLQRYLHDEPVQAGPPGTGYRLRKFLRRNQAAVLMVGLLVGLLFAAVVGTTIGLVRALAAEQLASERLLEVQDAQEVTTEALAQTQQANVQTQQALKESEAAKAREQSQRQQAEKSRDEAELAKKQQEIQRQQAEAERDAKARALRRAEGLYLMSQSSAQVPVNPGLALVLAIDGADRAPAPWLTRSCWPPWRRIMNTGP